jgi:DNA-binding response OmpR family regulator
MVKEKTRILIVEDEDNIRAGISDVLAYHGYAPATAATGEEGLEKALAGDFAMILLDVMLPGVNGFEICRQVREQRPQQAILMLTAKGSEDDVVEGFQSGADDYVTKPFSIRELVARIEALLRRSGKLGGDDEVFAFGHWEIDRANRQARSEGRVQELTEREVDLLAFFSREKGRIVSRRSLLQEVWGMANVDDVYTRTVDMHIAKLRKKIDGESESTIETVRGAGYRFKG